MRFCSLFCSIVLLLTSHTLAARAESPDAMFTRANSLYSSGDFEASAELYDSLLQRGAATADVYFNLGNAYYKLNKIPLSILNYERARKLEPGDLDIKHNLVLARSATVDDIEELPRLFIWEWLDSARDLFRADTWAIVFLLLFWIAVAFFAMLAFVKSPSTRRLALTLGLVLTFCALASGFLCYERHHAETGRNAAIILAPSIYVKSAPQDSGKDVFILHEGTRVEILEELEGWSRIRIANGQVGWSRSLDLEVI